MLGERYIRLINRHIIHISFFCFLFGLAFITLSDVEVAGGDVTEVEMSEMYEFVESGTISGTSGEAVFWDV